MIGSDTGNSNYMNGYFTRIAVGTARPTDAVLKSFTK